MSGSITALAVHCWLMFVGNGTTVTSGGGGGGSVNSKQWGVLTNFRQMTYQSIRREFQKDILHFYLWYLHEETPKKHSIAEDGYFVEKQYAQYWSPLFPTGEFFG